MKAFDLLQVTLNAELAPGQFWQDEFNSWHWLAQGILLVEPLNHLELSKCQRAIVLSCGVHGNETAPIELLVDMVKQLSEQPRQLQARVLFIVGNPPAVVNQTRFVDENLNRLFTPQQKQTEAANPEQQRAVELMTAVDQFFAGASAKQRRVHYDLHTAIRDSQHPFFAVYPFAQQGFSRAAVARMQAADVHTVLLSHAPASTFSHYSHAYHQAEAFTVELGKVKPFGENDMTKLQPLKQLLANMLYGDWPEPNIEPSQLNLFTVTRAVNRNHQAFELNFDDNLANFSRFAEGAVLARDGETEIRAEHDGEAIVFPNRKVAIGQRAMLTVIEADANILRD